MRGVIRAELVRMRRRPLSLAPVALLTLFVVLPLVLGLLSRVHPIVVAWAQSSASLPGGLWSMTRGAQALMPVAMAVLACSMTGEDYGAGVLKVLAPRVTSRAKLLLGKALVATAGALGLAVAMMAGIGVSALAARVVVVGPLTDGPMAWGELGGALAFQAVQACFVVSLSVLVTTVAQSQTVGLLLGVLGPPLLRALTFVPGGKLLPARQLDVLEAMLLPGGSSSPDDLTAMLGYAPTLGGALALVLGASAVFLAAAVVVFQRRDIR